MRTEQKKNGPKEAFHTKGSNMNERDRSKIKFCTERDQE